MKIKDNKTGKIKDVRLPKRLKSKWVKALRSGEYKQGNNYLEQDNKFCCLGVLCKVTNPSIELNTAQYIGDRGMDTTGIPKILQGEAYEQLSNPIVYKLVLLNDDKNYSFKQIASYIERNL